MDETSVLHLTSNTDRPDWQDSRLAELVLLLTGCSADEAMLAVSAKAPEAAADDADSTLDDDEALERVARAILRIRNTRPSTDA